MHWSALYLALPRQTVGAHSAERPQKTDASDLGQPPLPVTLCSAAALVEAVEGHLWCCDVAEDVVKILEGSRQHGLSLSLLCHPFLPRSHGSIAALMTPRHIFGHGIVDTLLPLFWRQNVLEKVLHVRRRGSALKGRFCLRRPTNDIALEVLGRWRAFVGVGSRPEIPQHCFVAGCPMAHRHRFQ